MHWLDKSLGSTRQNGSAMDLKHLRTFVTVAEARTESKASQLLHISQSALSRQVTNLEEEFGLKLFERIGRRLNLRPSARTDSRIAVTCLAKRRRLASGSVECAGEMRVC